MFLLDTCVLSEMRKSRPNTRVVAWLEKHHRAEMFLSAITIGEVEAGIAKRRAGDPSFAEALEQWLEEVVGYYDERILPVSLEIARLWGNMNPGAGNATDKLIAATATIHGLKLVTRNHRHFEPLGVVVVNPFGD